MAITFINSTHTGPGAGGTATEPASVQYGDVLLACVQADVAHNGPSGWTQVGTSINIGAGHYRMSFWWIKRGDAAPSLTWTVAADYIIDILAYRGCIAGLDSSGQSAASSAVAPSVTPTVVNAMLFCYYSDDADTSITVPAGMTSRGTTTSFNRMAELQLTTITGTGTKTFTTTTTPIGAYSITLAPALSHLAFTSKPPRTWSVF